MKIGKLFLLILCLFLLIVNNLKAQDFQIDAEFRPRFEFRDGFQKPLTIDENPALQLANRTRLGIAFENQWVNARITLQDARIWGQDAITSNTLNIHLFEAWAELNVVKDFSFRIGRQPLSYDYKRLFDVKNSTVNGSSHDLALLKYKNSESKFFADLGFAYNTTGEYVAQEIYDNSKLYQSFAYLRLEKSFCKSFKASAIFVGESFQNIQTDSLDNDYIDGNFGRYTTGANLEMKSKEFPLSFILTGYYQFGKSYSKKDLVNDKYVHRDLNAYFLAAKLNYRIIKPLDVNVGLDYYSGSKSDATKDNTWNKLYGSNHSYNGSMEYWRSVPTAGLIDIYGGLVGKISPKVTADLAFHYFMTDKEMNITGVEGKALGSELDLSVKYNIVKYVQLQCGYSTYFNSDNTKLVKNMSKDTETRFQHWAFAQLTVNPILFSTKK